MSRRKSIARRGNKDESILKDQESSVVWISPTVKGGMLNKRGRGRTLSFMKPWALRYVTVDVESGELTYHVEVSGYFSTFIFLLLLF